MLPSKISGVIDGAAYEKPLYRLSIYTGAKRLAYKYNTRTKCFTIIRQSMEAMQRRRL